MKKKLNNREYQSFRAICYRDLPQDGYHNAYELINQPGDLIIKEQIIKGQFGYPDIYIRHLSLTLTKGGRIPLISYTNYEMTPEKGLEILAGALQLINNE